MNFLSSNFRLLLIFGICFLPFNIEVRADSIRYEDIVLCYAIPLNSDYGRSIGIGGFSGMRKWTRTFPEVGVMLRGSSNAYNTNDSKANIIMDLNIGFRYYAFRWHDLENYLRFNVGIHSIYEHSSNNSGIEWFANGRHGTAGFGSDLPIGRTWLCGVELSYSNYLDSNFRDDRQMASSVAIQLHFQNRYKRQTVNPDEIF